MKDFHEQTYYELLDVSANASQEEILKAYNRARSTYGNNSPALYSLFNKEEAQELLKLIDEAYTVLSNPFKRKQYDQGATGESVSPDADTSKPTSASAGSSSPSLSTTTHSVITSIGATGSQELKTLPASAVGDASLTAQDFANQQTGDLSFFGGDESTQDVPVKPVETPGLGSTVFSRYNVDTVFEEEIKVAQVFSGELLHKIRIYKNVTLDQISEMTKVSRAYLVALESDNYTSLPASVFIRGFLVQISKILNLDGAKVANSYLKQKEKNKK
jgi:hypothetical protein